MTIRRFLRATKKQARTPVIYAARACRRAKDKAIRRTLPRYPGCIVKTAFSSGRSFVTFRSRRSIDFSASSMAFIASIDFDRHRHPAPTAYRFYFFSGRLRPPYISLA